jgi:hypothetical protein
VVPAQSALGASSPCATSAHVTPLVQVGQVVLEHRPEQQFPPQHCVPVEQATPFAPHVGQVALEHSPEQQFPPQHCAPVEQAAPLALHVGQVALEHRPEQQFPPQHCAPVEQAAPLALHVGQVALEHRPEQQFPPQHCAPAEQAAPFALHVCCIVHWPATQLVPEQQGTDVLHASPLEAQAVAAQTPAVQMLVQHWRPTVHAWPVASQEVADVVDVEVPSLPPPPELPPLEKSGPTRDGPQATTRPSATDSRDKQVRIFVMCAPGRGPRERARATDERIPALPSRTTAT